jgi:predicted CopG family antitoxin
MQRKLTITIDDQVYRGLHEQIGRGNISGFIEDLVRPHIVTETDMEDGYRAMVADAERERDAAEWAEGLIGESPV